MVATRIPTRIENFITSLSCETGSSVAAANIFAQEDLSGIIIEWLNCEDLLISAAKKSPV